MRVEKDKALLVERGGSARELLAPDTAAGLAAYRPAGNAAFSVKGALAVSGAESVPKANQRYVVGAKFELDLLAAIAKDALDRGGLRITFVDDQAKVLRVDGGLPFYIAATEGDKPKRDLACGGAAAQMIGAVKPSGALAGAEEGVPASPFLCAVVAKEKGLEARPYESWVLFNSTGIMCYAPDLLRQRDRIRFGMVLIKGEPRPDAVSASVASCTTPTPGHSQSRSTSPSTAIA